MNAVAELATTAAMELRPPAAAPEAARGSAEPQLVAAGAVSPMTRLAAPVPPNGSSAARVAAAPSEPGWGELARPESGWPERDWPERHWPEPNQVAPDPAVGTEPGRADPPAAAWTLGQRSNGHEVPDGRRADLMPAELGGQNRPERNHGYAPSHRAPVPVDAVPLDGAPADATPGGRAGTRSIIGTPPPAVTGQQPIAMLGSDRSLLERKDAGQVESGGKGAGPG